MINYIRNKKGFTLVEIIVVLVIIAILAATTLPALSGYITDAREKTAISEGRTVLVAAQTIASEMKGQGETDERIVAQIKSVREAAVNKYSYINKLTGMNLAAGAVTNVIVDAEGAVTDFTLAASNSKTVIYADKNFAIGTSGK